ncbi:MAG: glycosyltransferase [Acidobacteriota bacterium]|nr:glycosyltransferase [Acidobacteriota bacterium]
MKTFFDTVWRVIKFLPLLIISPLLISIPLLAIAITDVWFGLRSRRPFTPNNQNDKQPARHAASVVIPNWNGRDLLAQYLPSVVAALSDHPGNEVIVVDNGSTDGSAAYVRETFPTVRLLALEKNLGFGGGSNAGFRSASNDIVVLLNSDMRVERGFLQPLLDGFTDEKVFAVSCQIFFSDPGKLREETGLTQCWWENGGLRARHRIDDAIQSPYPCFYGGGGSCAFDRSKFLKLGGFDELLAPFYLEDTDLGFLAWKRGWKVLYQPLSIVYHEHRGTIGRRFSTEQINVVLKRNFILFCWKNIHEWNRLGSHFFFTFSGAVLSVVFGDSPERPNLPALWKAVLRLPTAVRSRYRAHSLATISDTEAFSRPLGGYFRDRFFQLAPDPEPLQVLFISPYTICPPIHGGAVFMSQTVRYLARLSSLHLIILLDHEHERGAHQELERTCRSVEYVIRMQGKQKQLGSIVPHAVTEFKNSDLEWLIHRQIFIQGVDVIQIEYTALAQYTTRLRQIPSILFEHDVYFQSIGRQLPYMRGWVKKSKAMFEYMRALRFELGVLPKFDRIQVCSPANREYLAGFVPELANRIDDDLRAGIDTTRYDFQTEGREPFTMLFLGSFRHTPNQEALAWFVNRALPRVLEQCPQARLVVVGSDPPPRHSLPDLGNAIELRGFVEDVMEPLRRYAVFVCPILAGSGMRVKLLEAFAAGIPVVSTRVGAEGLANQDGDLCLLSDDPAEFADKVLSIFADQTKARDLAQRAREHVVATKDMAVMTKKLAENYRRAVEAKRSGGAAYTSARRSIKIVTKRDECYFNQP